MFPKLEVVSTPIAKVATDALIVGVYQESAKAVDGKRAKLQGPAAAVDAATGGAITAHLATGDFSGKRGDVAVLYPSGLAAKRVLLVGGGKKADFDTDAVRVVVAKGARRAQALGAATIAIGLHGAPDGDVEAAVEGALLGLYKFEAYQGKGTKKDEPPKHVASVVVLVDGGQARAAKAAAEIARVTSESVWLARDLATFSGKEAAAPLYGERAKKLAKETGLHCEVLDKAACEKLGMGAFLGVNQGSDVPPAFVVLEHNRGKKNLPTVVVIGKGITFDSGGISIKPSDKMEDMKFDKSGACAMFGILRTAALLKLPLHVVGLAPFTDNMPSGKSYRPGDVLTAMDGVTIEVNNTDAEGRLVLADALAYAKRYEPDAVVDMATLTGAVVVALGPFCSGMMGTDERLMKRLEKAADATHERVWRLPFYDEYDEIMKSKYADIKNSGGRAGGAITGGRFLRKFAGDMPWVHLDIAGTAWSEGSPSYNEAYSPGVATGVGVRLIVRMLRDWKK